MGRKRLTPAARLKVYEKMNGHCAYCGCKLEYKDMRVDHIEPLYLGGKDDILNMFPACHSCNHYKSTLTLDKFRAAIERFPDVLSRDSITYKNAVRYNLVVPNPHRVIFYFESMEV